MKIEIEEKLSDYIEMLQYDLDSIKELLARAASIGVESGEMHKEWLDKYLEKGREYNAAKAEVERMYVVPNIGNGETVNWSLDFYTHTVTIEAVSANG